MITRIKYTVFTQHLLHVALETNRSVAIRENSKKKNFVSILLCRYVGFPEMLKHIKLFLYNKKPMH